MKPSFMFLVFSIYVSISIMLLAHIYHEYTYRCSMSCDYSNAVVGFITGEQEVVDIHAEFCNNICTKGDVE